MKQSLGLVSLVFLDCDEHSPFFVGKLGFVLVENSFSGAIQQWVCSRDTTTRDDAPHFKGTPGSSITKLRFQALKHACEVAQLRRN